MLDANLKRFFRLSVAISFVKRRLLLLAFANSLPPLVNTSPQVSAVVRIIEDGLVVNLIELFESALGESTIISLW